MSQPLPGSQQTATLQHNVSNLFDVGGRIALVTGGSSGIGLMIAEVNTGSTMPLYFRTGRLMYIGTHQ